MGYGDFDCGANVGFKGNDFAFSGVWNIFACVWIMYLVLHEPNDDFLLIFMEIRIIMHSSIATLAEQIDWRQKIF